MAINNKFLLCLFFVFIIAGFGCSRTPKASSLGIGETVAFREQQANGKQDAVISENAGASFQNTNTAASESISANLKTDTAKTKTEDKKEPEQEPVTRKSYIKNDRQMHPFLFETVKQAHPANSNVKWAGEEMEFSIKYSFVHVGTAYIKHKGVVETGFGSAYVIETTADSAAVIDAFFKVRDINYSFISTSDYRSLGYSQSIREGGYMRDEWLTFDKEGGVVFGLMRKKDGKDRLINGAVSGPVQDMLSTLYYIRGHDFSKDADLIFDVTNRDTTYPLIVKVLKRETVKTKAGKFKCIKIEPRFRGEGIFIQKGKSLQIWLTDDEYKMPVKMKTQVAIGSVSAELVAYKRR